MLRQEVLDIEAVRLHSPLWVHVADVGAKAAFLAGATIFDLSVNASKLDDFVEEHRLSGKLHKDRNTSKSLPHTVLVLRYVSVATG